MKMFDLWDATDGRCHIFVREEGSERSERVLDGPGMPLIRDTLDISDYIVKRVEPKWLPNYGMVLKVIIEREEE